MKNIPPPTLSRLRELMAYDPLTGEFRHIRGRRGTARNSLAGTLSSSDGLRYISVDDKRYGAHRLAWFYETGNWPKYEVGFLDKTLPSPLRERFDNLSMTDIAKGEEFGPDVLRKLFHYDPETGIFAQKTARRGVTIGKRAGSVEPNGYRLIRVRGKDYGANRLAWLYVYGEWPTGKVMYRNGNGDDCRIENLYQEVDAYAVPELRRIRDREDRKKNWQKYRAHDLKRDFGLTPEQYAAKLEAQSGVCEICKKPETRIAHGRVSHLAVDHDHVTGAIRDLLCHHCNNMIGRAQDRPDLLRAAAVYLERHAAALPDNVIPLKGRKHK